MEAVADCFARTGIGAFPGDCDAHRAGILVGRGAWSQGELEARRACAQVERIDLAHVGQALHEIGEIRLPAALHDGTRLWQDASAPYEAKQSGRPGSSTTWRRWAESRSAAGSRPPGSPGAG